VKTLSKSSARSVAGTIGASGSSGAGQSPRHVAGCEHRRETGASPVFCVAGETKAAKTPARGSIRLRKLGKIVRLSFAPKNRLAERRTNAKKERKEYSR
jgi:hypothetical protein